MYHQQYDTVNVFIYAMSVRELVIQKNSLIELEHTHSVSVSVAQKFILFSFIFEQIWLALFFVVDLFVNLPVRLFH